MFYGVTLSSRLLLGTAPHDPQVRQLRRPPLEEVALASLRLEQRHVPARQRRCERDPGRAAARADVHDRPVLALDERHGA